ncbi:TPA: peptidase domain-containing ABC transporter [Enterobacter hormaechei subsp. steigerwaltii]|nr:peptidase domain-containing ABC transporter [Enterobacter hormaechei subsp. steigerwaltii]
MLTLLFSTLIVLFAAGGYYLFRFRHEHFIWQKSAMDCGPTCLQIISLMHGYFYQIQKLRHLTNMGRDGVSLANLESCAQQLGFHTHALSVPISHLKNIPLPAILHWNKDHFVVLTSTEKGYHIQDPALGKVRLTETELSVLWTGDETAKTSGVVLVLQVPDNGLCQSEQRIQNRGLKYLLLEFFQRRWKFLWRLLALISLGSLLLICQPWLWSIILDNAIDKNNVRLLSLILMVQGVLALILLWLNFSQGRHFLSISNSLAKHLLSGFLTKLIRLPMHVFERRPLGDLSQRLDDVERIQGLLRGQPLVILISALSGTVFILFLFYYQPEFALLFVCFTALAFLWSFYFYRKRRVLDYQYFSAQVHYQDQVLDILNGAAEIKALNFGEHKLKRWRYLYARSYSYKRELEKISLMQRFGYRLLHVIKDISIFYLAGIAVINGSLTTGILLSVSYILQQLNQPLEDILVLLDEIQDCHLSAERLSDLLDEPEDLAHAQPHISGELCMKNVFFAYPGKQDLLKDISFNLPDTTITAVVGTSGSGKSTLLKILQGFYPVNSGEIILGGNIITNNVFPVISHQSSVVQQEGYLFSDTVKGNIILDRDWNLDWFEYILHITCLKEWISSLDQQELTMLGHGGNPVSGGQKQRILLARALYRKPVFLFLDEASSALDAMTERVISSNLTKFCHQNHCTALIIAHRLSTIRNADHILVIDDGMLVEQGTHDELLVKTGAYAKLLQHQIRF